MTGRQILERALAAHGITQPERVESHIRGCDLSFAVEERRLGIGFTFDIWVRDGGVPGKYAAPTGEDPAQLGIMIEKRHREVFVVQSEFMVTASIAALFPAGRVEHVGDWAAAFNTCCLLIGRRRWSGFYDTSSCIAETEFGRSRANR